MQNKRKRPDPPPCSLEEAKVIVSRLRNGPLTQDEISAKTNIHQGQVSRIIKGEFKTLRGRALELCKFALQVEASYCPSATEDMERQLIHRVLTLWDRSVTSGRRLIDLLDAVENYSGRGKS